MGINFGRLGFLASIGREPLLACFMGALVTSLSYSSLAIMLIIASFVANGSLDVRRQLQLPFEGGPVGSPAGFGGPSPWREPSGRGF